MPINFVTTTLKDHFKDADAIVCPANLSGFISSGRQHLVSEFAKNFRCCFTNFRYNEYYKDICNNQFLKLGECDIFIPLSFGKDVPNIITTAVKKSYTDFTKLEDLKKCISNLLQTITDDSYKKVVIPLMIHHGEMHLWEDLKKYLILRLSDFRGITFIVEAPEYV